MARLIRSVEGFVSGLSDRIPGSETESTRTLEQGLEEFLRAPAEKANRRRRGHYNVPGTPATRRETLRRVGEKDD